MPKTELPATMRVGRHLAQQLLLRTGAGERAESGTDAAVGPVASEPPGLWKPPFNRAIATGGPGDQSQAGDPPLAAHGHRGGVSQTPTEPTWRRAPHLPLPVGRAGNQRS